MSSEKEVPKDITFFLVEDMSFYRDLFVQSLSNLGFEGKLIQSKNLKEAMKKLKELGKRNEKIDFIISDLNLPDGTGKILCEKVRASKTFKNVPFLIVTVADDPHSVIDSFESGVDNYLLKPIEEKDLFEKITFCWNSRNK